MFLLLNPFVLYVGAAWGQIDTIVALLALAALVLLSTGRRDGSAGLLALAFTVKPIALPVLPVALVSVATGSWRKAARYAAIFLGGVVALYVLPFFVFGWSLDPFFRHLNAHFLMHGTMSYMTVVRVFRDLDLLQGSWWLLGLIWIAALAVGTVLLGRGDGSLEDLLKKSTALLLVVFLTRTWLAEPNVILVLPLVLILASIGVLDRRALTAVWVIPLLFTRVQRLAAAPPVGRVPGGDADVAGGGRPVQPRRTAGESRPRRSPGRSRGGGSSSRADEEDGARERRQRRRGPQGRPSRRATRPGDSCRGGDRPAARGPVAQDRRRRRRRRRLPDETAAEGAAPASRGARAGGGRRRLRRARAQARRPDHLPRRRGAGLAARRSSLGGDGGVPT